MFIDRFGNRQIKSEDPDGAEAVEINSAEDAFARLGIDATSTPVEIRQAYKKSIARYHPDKVERLGDEFKKLAEEKSKAIIAAYRFLEKERFVD